MNPHGSTSLFVIYRWSGLITLAILLFALVERGLSAMFLVLVLGILEVTFSFDNAVINSKVLVTMHRFWQTLFMTVGIFIAVFVVRFYLPILIVQLTAGLGFTEVINLALNDAATYGEKLHEAGPMIEAFGGTFLLMIGVSYFLDHQKDSHWLQFGRLRLEERLSAAGRFDNLTIMVMLSLSLMIFFTVGSEQKLAVFSASVIGVTLHVGLGLFGSLFGGDEEDERPSTAAAVKQKVGMAAFASFLYLEVLDASFSFDGVIGAFAITTDVFVIMAGLGTGAIWVRSMTVHLVRAKTLGTYVYLEHGAHWAILALGGIMLGKLYHVELPEVVTGCIGLFFIGLAFISSKRYARLHPEEARSSDSASVEAAA